MNGRRQIVVLGLAATVLLLALALQFVRLRDVQRGDITTPPRPIGLRARIPLALPGWTGRDEPLGPTESVNRAVAQNLNFDEVCHRRYEKPGFSLGVYVAYWSAGRMPLQKVASHTPDRCWSESGWTCTEARFPFTLTRTGNLKAETGNLNAETGNLTADSGNLNAETGNLKGETGNLKAKRGNLKAETGNLTAENGGRWTVDGEDGNRKADSGKLKAETGNLKPEAPSSLSSGLRSHPSALAFAPRLRFQPSALAFALQPSALVSLKPAYWRSFTPPGGTEPMQVLYWHLVGDELYDYGGGFNRRPGFLRWWRDMLRYAFAGSREQFFIRLTSNRPFEELEADAGFRAIVEALGELGVKDETGRRKPET